MSRGCYVIGGSKVGFFVRHREKDDRILNSERSALECEHGDVDYRAMSIHSHNQHTLSASRLSLPLE